MAGDNEVDTQQPKTALVVENTSTGSVLAVALREAGWQVMLCHRGRQALDSVRLQPWDAMVIGFRLIDMRGDAVAYAACAERETLEGRILILTDDAIGGETARAAHFDWLPATTPVEAIVTHLTQRP